MSLFQQSYSSVQNQRADILGFKAENSRIVWLISGTFVWDICLGVCEQGQGGINVNSWYLCLKALYCLSLPLATTHFFSPLADYSHDRYWRIGWF